MIDKGVRVHPFVIFSLFHFFIFSFFNFLILQLLLWLLFLDESYTVNLANLLAGLGYEFYTNL